MKIKNVWVATTHPWTPKPWKMKVLNPQYMGYNPQKWRNRGFPWQLLYSDSNASKSDPQLCLSKLTFTQAFDELKIAVFNLHSCHVFVFSWCFFCKECSHHIAVLRVILYRWILVSSYGWWLKSGDHHLGWCWKPINNGINYQPQLVFTPDFSHQPYHLVSSEKCFPVPTSAAVSLDSWMKSNTKNTPSKFHRIYFQKKMHIYIYTCNQNLYIYIILYIPGTWNEQTFLVVCHFVYLFTFSSRNLYHEQFLPKRADFRIFRLSSHQRIANTNCLVIVTFLGLQLLRSQPCMLFGGSFFVPCSSKEF